VQESVLEAGVRAAAVAAEAYRPVALREYLDQVQALPQVLEQVAAAVAQIQRAGSTELPIAPAWVEHLERVEAAVRQAGAIAARPLDPHKSTVESRDRDLDPRNGQQE
jgi:hypothetical protein